MPIYQFRYIYAGSDFADANGDPKTNLELGIYTLSPTATSLSISIEDDDTVLEDNVNATNGQTLDGSQEWLAEEFDGYPVNTNVFSRATYDVQVTTPDGQILTGEANQLVVGTTRYTVFQFPVPPGSTVNFLSFTTVGNTPYADFVCFAAGTLIATPGGRRPVETLGVGDLVLTLDHGEQPIRWIGSRTFVKQELERNPKLYPVRISKGALGNGLPEQDLLVSPQHRLLLRSRIVRRMFDCEEVLVAAKKLVNYPGICIDTDVSEVTYVHFLCDRHEVVDAEGALAESLYLGAEARNMLGREALDEICAIFPDLAFQSEEQVVFRDAPFARPVVRGKRQQTLLRRHVKNHRQPLLSRIGKSRQEQSVRA